QGHLRAHAPAHRFRHLDDARIGLMHAAVRVRSIERELKLGGAKPIFLSRPRRPVDDGSAIRVKPARVRLQGRVRHDAVPSLTDPRDALVGVDFDDKVVLRGAGRVFFDVRHQEHVALDRGDAHQADTLPSACNSLTDSTPPYSTACTVVSSTSPGSITRARPSLTASASAPGQLVQASIAAW